MQFIKNKQNKQAIKTNRRNLGNGWRVIVFGLACLFVSSGLLSIYGAVPSAQARNFDAEIAAIQSQINDYRKRSGELAAKSDTLQSKIDILQNQQAEIQAQIDLNEAKKQKILDQIATAEAKIKSQSKIMSENLQEQYYSSKTTPLDILMNSKSVSDYIDRQTRQQSLKDQITASVNKIKELKAELQTKKADVEKILDRQNKQKQVLQASKDEQQHLLDETKGLESKYQELTSGAEARKARVQREQQEAIARYRANSSAAAGVIVANSQCGGGYPFCNNTPDTSASAGGFRAYGNTRECVNYVQWRIFALTGRNELHGNAGDWAGVANSEAKPGTVAIVSKYTLPPYGHVAWVERMGTGAHAGEVYISEYNWSPYSYTERWVPISSFTGGFYNPL